MYSYYCKFWLATKDQLQDVLLREKFLRTLGSIKQRAYAHRIFVSLYGRYVVLCNNLADIYDQTLQVQKRSVLQNLLEAATQRLLELETCMKRVDLCEFIYVDETIRELVLTIQDVQLLRPFYFPFKRPGEVQDILAKQEAKRKKLEDQQYQIKFKNAVNMIKLHERARQARITYLKYADLDILNRKFPRIDTYSFYHKEDEVPLIPISRYTTVPNFCKELHDVSNFSFYVPPGEEQSAREMEARRVVRVHFDFILEGHKEVGPCYKIKERLKDTDPLVCPTVPDPRTEELIQIVVNLPRVDWQLGQSESTVFGKYGPRAEAAATKIQRFFLHYLIRKRVRMRQYRKLVYLGMIEGAPRNQALFDLMQKNRIQRRLRKEQFDTEFTKAIEDTSARIIALRGPYIMEDISEDIREWFREFYENANDFDNYPSEKAGGTILVLRGQTKTVAEFKAAKKETKEDKKKRLDEEKAKKAKEKEEAQAKAFEKQMRALTEKKQKDTGYKLNTKSKPAINLDETMREYETNWAFINEELNVQENMIMDLEMPNIMMPIHLDLRTQVDEFMRIEHELLRLALAKDNKKNKKGKKDKGENNEKKKGKGTKKGKEKIKKEKHKLTSDVPSEELFNQLVEMKIIVQYPKRRLEELIADYNFSAEEDQLKGLFPTHYLGDLKQTLRSVVLGMGPLTYKTPKSLLLCGPKLSGKKFIVDALCTEIEAVLFDLSPEKTKEVTNVKEFTEAINQMALWLQPSVVFINNVHRVFYKKVPPQDLEENPNIKNLAKVLKKKIVKKLTKKNNRVLVVGTSNEPWAAKMGQMNKCFEQRLLIPALNYACSAFTWRLALNRKGFKTLEAAAIARTLPLSSGQILGTIDETLNIRRRMQLSRKPFQLEEFMQHTLFENPDHFPLADKKLAEKYIKWFEKANKYAKLAIKKQKKLAKEKAEKEKGKKK